jgi:1-carboxybiuret hydrolase
VQAQKSRRWFRDAMRHMFRDVDAILAPATPCVAPLIGQKTFVLDGKEMPLRPNIGVYTQPISFIGLPVAAVPVMTDCGLPTAVQIIAAPWREDVALRVAQVLESAGIARAPEPPREF